ncbi:aminoglycoside N(3)-acetyltransferase [Streptacidiphilus neutrinimicus]|uniref:aminoglycoside N(3)-acetyltransferase n=1 Tax=Streptacidiphilus neutrinimicus TaxID=105420 RepID=UPI0005AB572D|nr:AAC(3) family N-acetyltransferase [Streptacidiphilus neutrinimicus]
MADRGGRVDVQAWRGLLGALGRPPGGVLLVQASLHRLGPVAGEEDDPQGRAGVVARALREALGEDGTLVAYTATPENSQTSRLYREATAGLSAAKLEIYHERMPAFDPVRTPSSPTVGRLSEAIRLLPGARRSAHPQTSFAAVGPLAEEITGEHPLAQHLGWDSPLGRLYGCGAQALLIGTGARSFTPFHLLDYRLDAPVQTYRAKRLDRAGRPYWHAFQGVSLDDLHFPELGRRVLALGRAAEPPLRIPRAPIGGTSVALVPIRAVVDLAAKVAVRATGVAG